MNWLKLIIGLFSALATYVNNKRIADGAKAELELDSIKDANEKIAAADDARVNVDRLPVESDPQNRANKRKL